MVVGMMGFGLAIVEVAGPVVIGAMMSDLHGFEKLVWCGRMSGGWRSSPVFRR